jgi:protein-tyrosine phosphatase/membrane-associated phospholipid phosphatase
MKPVSENIENTRASLTDGPVGMWRAAAASASLSVLFLVVYGFCGWYTAQRAATVGTWRYDWERHIPFLPWFIVPYMSIDLFFVAAPFLCATRRELRTLSGRIATAIVIAGVCFLVAPLKLAVDRPHVEGWLGAIFNPFVAMDKPFNLCPSLHIALRTILAEFYVRHARGAWRTASHVWFSLIGFSTLFTYQHHVIDIIGGFILAVLCFYLVAEPNVGAAFAPNRRVGAFYLIGGTALAAAGYFLGGWWRWLWWPAAAMLIVVAGYFALASSIYRKRDGTLPLAARILMFPVLAGQRLSLRHYRRQCRAWDEAAPGVWIGRCLNDAEAREAVDRGVKSVLDLTCEFTEAAPFRACRYRNLPILDLTAPTPAQLREAVEFISRHVADGPVYVHCKIGYSRSAAVVGAYLMHAGLTTSADDAVAHLRSVRPSIVVRPEAVATLREFERSHTRKKKEVASS